MPAVPSRVDAVLIAENRAFTCERSYGSFRRLIPLPEGVNAEKAQATFKNGVLEVTMEAPRLQSRGRRIEIQGESGAAGQTSPRAEAGSGGSR